MKVEVENKKKILLVDDSAENLRILLEVLRDDYQVVAARDGEKALELARQLPPPDIILLDVMMPGMDGYAVCGELKQGQATRDIPVIFVTALTEEESEEHGFEVGAVDYITKPISPPVVRARVRTHLALKQAQCKLERQNRALLEAAQLREDVERIMQHDLKGPLSTVISMPGLLLGKENISEAQKKTLTLIREAGYHMLDMVNHSLDLYKMEAGSYRYSPQRFDLLPLLHKVLGELENLCRAHEVTLRIEGGEAPFMVTGEELLSHSMFSNLLKNAVEASPPGADVEVALRRRGGTPAVRIRNRGEVASAIRERFFDKYITSGKEGGTGLGTYSAYLAARTQGGGIELDSSEPGHTAITVTLLSA